MTTPPSIRRSPARKSVAVVAMTAMGAVAGCAGPADHDAKAAAGRAGTPQVTTVASGRSPSPSSSPTARPAVVLTESDHKREVTLERGEFALLRLPTTMRWTTPRVEGSAVRVTGAPRDPDDAYAEWTVYGVRVGEASVHTTGEPPCPDDPKLACMPYQQPVRINVRVVG